MGVTARANLSTYRFGFVILKEVIVLLKKLFKFIIPIVLLLPIILYVAIVITNNCIADKIEKDLIKYDLPANTVLVDSISAAGKLMGSGNGMQYMGSILVSSDLTEQDISSHYGKQFDFIEVRHQETEALDFIMGHKQFKQLKDTNIDTYYSVTCWNENTTENLGDFIIFLLNLDLRAH